MNSVVDRNFLQNFLEDMPYGIPNYLVDYAVRSTHVPVGIWRSIYYSQNAFFKESFIDEMAHAGGRDPYRLRRVLLAGKPRHLAVLDAAAMRAGWQTAAPPGVFRGIALNEACGSVCAQVVEASVSDAGAVRVHRVVSAIDCGHVVNPLTVELQTQGAIVFALTAALYDEITIADGRVQQSNFHDYEMLRMARHAAGGDGHGPDRGIRRRDKFKRRDLGRCRRAAGRRRSRRPSAMPSSRQPAGASVRCRSKITICARNRWAQSLCCAARATDGSLDWKCRWHNKAIAPCGAETANRDSDGERPCRCLRSAPCRRCCCPSW